MNFRCTAMVLVLIIIASVLANFAAYAGSHPVFRDRSEISQKPDLSGIDRLRFLTTTDFPPFNHTDANGRLAGFNIDLARDICDVLKIDRECQVQAIPFSELQNALANRQGDAIIAGLAATPKTRDRFLFTRSYFQFPARFVTKRDKADGFWANPSLEGKRVGVIGSSNHEKMLRAYFPDASTVVYSRADWMFDDLREGRIDGVFYDGMRLAVWLGGSSSQKCCVFAGDAYFATDYLGSGLSIAVRKDRRDLADALDYALGYLEENGKTSELYLRYFPVGFY
jgi:polar amino acid transport system substrate-binding protein